MMKKFLVSMVFTLVAGLLPVIAQAACSVPSSAYPTIQSAVSDPGCAVINVAPGNYPENVVIYRSLTLNGAQAGVDARTRTGGSGESVIDGGIANVTINADNVTLDGFTLPGPVNQGSAAVVMMGSNKGEKIQNNVFQNPGRAASFNTSNTTFFQNAVHNTPTAGDGFQENSSTASNVLVLNNSFDGGSGANYNADVTILGPNSSNISVIGNTSTIDSTLVALFQTNGALVAGNKVTNPSGSAIYIGGNDSNITVSGNQISGGAYSAVRVSNAFGQGPSSNITVTGNYLKTTVTA